MSYCFSARVDVDFRSISVVLEKMGLPTPISSPEGKFAFEANADVVRQWRRRDRALCLRLEEGGTIGPVQHQFLVFMTVLWSDILDYVYKNDIDIQTDYFEEGVPDGYIAVWFGE